LASRVDLHTHTTASDGTLSPAELFEKAAALNLKVLAISDHDSTEGYAAVLPLCKEHPTLRVIPAIELNAEGEWACHILGYFIDPLNSDLQKELEGFRRRRVSRIRAMAVRLRTLGVGVDFERVLAWAKGGSLGRPHLADALMENGVVKSRQEAFDRFLKKGGPAYVPSDSPTAPEIIALIRKAGGIPVLAHPSYYTSETLLTQLGRFGIMGIEAYYPEHSRSLVQRYLDLAKEHAWVVTGGSDFHGPRTGRAALASVDVPESVVEALEKARDRF
jgi:3',5'-nucleoside bisphosphate phosphatase